MYKASKRERDFFQWEKSQKHLKVVKIEKTSPGCPDQYEGDLSNGMKFYVRCRYGIAELRVGDQKQWEDWKMDTVVRKEWPEEPWKGVFEGGEMVEMFKEAGITLDVEPTEDPDRLVKFMENIQKILEKANEVEDQPSVRETAVFLTMDEDILRGKLKPGKEQQMMEQMRRKYKVETFNPEKDDV